ncbi:MULTISPECIES: hypothetical protein [Sporosarcina]|uniref:Uncharacterized protein n=1 Tax=Sporosarcina newyorkensis TaxID=759851 RepID=A0A1T4XJU3_9BACL|nr:hypothetical protein [Sporosarcina newyorkensis]SKA89385.1 hypothetical protein SAMN04244570_0833 [Sporosarcina newyorkensis]
MSKVDYFFSDKAFTYFLLICQITNIPGRSSEDIESFVKDLGKGINTLGINKAKSLGPFINEIVKEFSKINDMFSTVAYPDISVEPIAVYKEMKL